MAAMRDIAAAAEMQAASVYYYFESKEELLWAVWENAASNCSIGSPTPSSTRRILATHGNRLRRAYHGLARLAARQPGALHHAAVALPREHQGKGHRTAGRIRKDLHRPDRRPSPAQGRRSPLSASGSHRSALLVAFLVQEGARHSCRDSKADAFSAARRHRGLDVRIRGATCGRRFTPHRSSQAQEHRAEARSAPPSSPACY